MAERRTTLTKDDYVSVTVEYLGSHTLDELTMRAIGDELGVDATALYRHFPSKDALLDAVVDWMLGEIVAKFDPSITDPRESAVHGALTVRAKFAKYPQVGLALMSGEGGQGPNGVMFVRTMIETLRRMGIDGRDLVVAYQAFEGFVLGSCMQDFLGAPRNFDIRRDRYRRLEVPEFDAEATTAATVGRVADDAFRFGLEMFMDRCEELASARR